VTSQRKNYFISKDMQGRFAGTVLLLALLVTVITACNIYVLGSYFHESSITQTEGQTLAMIMEAFMREMWPRLIILVVVNIIIVFVVSVMYSHQIAGPAYKLESSIKRITDGDLTFEVSLRRNDNLKELAAALNFLLEKFRMTLANAKNLTEDIAEKLGALEDDERFKQLAASSKELRELISQFKIESEGHEILDDDENEIEDEATQES
jgi:methyl-accepting chemotaxis protein